MSDSIQEAWDDLNAAIQGVHEAQGMDGLVVDWVLVSQQLQAGLDGDAVSTSYMGAENQPRYRALGLVEYASTVLRAEIAADLDDGNGI